jgi:hypothetical protein
LTIDGTFLGSKGLIVRELGLYTQDKNFRISKTFILKVDKLIVKSPFTVIANGTVKGDVYVAQNAIGFAAQNGKNTEGKTVTAKIDGNLYFATQEQLDTYNQLDALAKYEVTGETIVKLDK